MCPEYGATVAIFPIDDMTLDYLRLTGRDESQVRAGRAVCEGAGAVPHDRAVPTPIYSEVDRARSRRRSSRASPGPKRPQDRVSLAKAKAAFQAALPSMQVPAERVGGQAARAAAAQSARGAWPSRRVDALDHGAVVIAAITSCTNTSNPSVMIGAGLLAKKAVEKGLTRKPWVKSSLAPGSKVVTEYLERGRA